MKKISLLYLLIMFFTFQSNGAGLVILDSDNNDITGDTMLVKKGADQQVIKAQMYLHNTSEERIYVLARKIEIELLEGTFNTFCWNGLCFPPEVFEATESMSLNPGETSLANDFYGEYYPNGQEGITIIEYEFFSAGKDFETVKTTVIYDTTQDTHAAPVFSFNIEDGMHDVPVDQVFVVAADQSIRHADGTVITDETLPDLINFFVADKAEGAVAFDAQINTEHTEITIVPVNPLAFDTAYMLEILPVMGVDEEVSESQMILFTTAADTDTSVAIPGASLYFLSDPMPNPSRDYAIIDYRLPNVSSDAYLQLFTVSGSLLSKLVLDPSAKRVTLNATALQNGIYFYSLVVDGRVVKTNRLIVNR